MAAAGDGLYEQGVECGRLLAEAGFGVVTGGYGGLMEAVSRGAVHAGGRALGVTVPDVFKERPGPNEFVSEEWRAAHLVERIHELTDVSAGAIVLPGSIGTMTELAVAWNLAYVARFSGEDPKPIITVGAMWAEVVQWLARRLETDLGLVGNAPDVPTAVGEMIDQISARER